MSEGLQLAADTLDIDIFEEYGHLFDDGNGEGGNGSFMFDLDFEDPPQQLNGLFKEEPTSQAFFGNEEYSPSPPFQAAAVNTTTATSPPFPAAAAPAPVTATNTPENNHGAAALQIPQVQSSFASPQVGHHAIPAIPSLPPFAPAAPAPTTMAPAPTFSPDLMQTFPGPVAQAPAMPNVFNTTQAPFPGFPAFGAWAANPQAFLFAQQQFQQQQQLQSQQQQQLQSQALPSAPPAPSAPSPQQQQQVLPLVPQVPTKKKQQPRKRQTPAQPQQQQPPAAAAPAPPAAAAPPAHLMAAMAGFNPQAAMMPAATQQIAAAAAAAAQVAQTKGRTRKRSQAQVEVRRERNRKLAKATRERKKEHFDALQMEILELQKSNLALKEMIKTNMDGDTSKKILDECDAMEKLPEEVVKACDEKASELSKEDFDLVSSIRKAQHAFVITDPSLTDNPIVFASGGFLTLTGYKMDQVLGRNCRFLQGTETSQEKVDMIRKAVTSGEDVSVTFINYMADGTPFWNHLFVAALRDENSNIVNFIGVLVKVASPKPDDPEFGKSLPGAVNTTATSGDDKPGSDDDYDDDDEDDGEK